jgi:hypothetical protein
LLTTTAFAFGISASNWPQRRDESAQCASDIVDQALTTLRELRDG